MKQFSEEELLGKPLSEDHKQEILAFIEKEDEGIDFSDIAYRRGTWHDKKSATSQPAGLKSMKSEDIRNREWNENERLALRLAASRQKAGDDSHINFEDTPRLTNEQIASVVRLRNVQRTVAASVRLDPRVVEWLKSKGEGHLTRINDILTNLMETERLPRSAKRS